eukprot:TRINITY_DN54507_c0_g1_i1.p1 TRINITY_DN54507_c0_g1~~TRINITY_DN54507_c0_g1_i1.p1  ORF type:complete len:208 (-),score=24.76 TRINITY_DN54507_c0_g1_i1:309-932(-)
METTHLTGFGMSKFTVCSMRRTISVMALLLSACGTTAWSNRTMQESYMHIALGLAQEAIASGGAPYGALIADPGSDQVVAIGRNHAGQNPIWHGEIAAITNLSTWLNETGRRTVDVAPSLELYTTAEPCPMCMSAIAWSGFGRVVYGTSIPFIEHHGGKQIGLRATEVAARAVAGGLETTRVVGGVLAPLTNQLYLNASIEMLSHRH